jgi:integrase
MAGKVSRSTIQLTRLNLGRSVFSPDCAAFPCQSGISGRFAASTDRSRLCLPKSTDAWKKWQTVRSRDDMIADDDLAPWYQAVKKLDSQDFRDYFTFLLVTGLRKHEDGSLKWEDVKFKREVFTARNTKNGRDHTLPMTDFIRDLLEHRADVKGNNEYAWASL